MLSRTVAAVVLLLLVLLLILYCTVLVAAIVIVLAAAVAHSTGTVPVCIRGSHLTKNLSTSIFFQFNTYVY